MMPKEDNYLRTRRELEADMAMSIGGRVAEELIFDDISTGASADIQHMTAVARRMVCLFGMSEKLGHVKLGDFNNHPHLRIDGPPPEGISNETEREIDLEVRRLVSEATEEARKIMREHRDQLEIIAENLLEKETLSIAEINELLGITEPDSGNVSGETAAGEAAPAESGADTETVAGDPAAEAEKDV